MSGDERGTDGGGDGADMEASMKAARRGSYDLALAPSQRQQLRGRDPKQRTRITTAALVLAAGAATAACITLFFDVPPGDVAGLFADVATGRRRPIAAQDGAGSLAAMALCLPPLYAADLLLRGLRMNDGARWFLLHAVGNMFVAAVATPDFYYAFRRPAAALSVSYCRALPFPACSEWPTCLIVAMHLYHIVAFRLGGDDIFHHLLFVPVIGLLHFVYPWGVAGNILCFFISGLPGGLDYFLLAGVKSGWVLPIKEKRINCSINTWLRGPGITGFIVLAGCAWMSPPDDTPEGDLIPAPFFCVGAAFCYFNAQYYSQRVIGNYYIYKCRAAGKGEKVMLHAS